MNTFCKYTFFFIILSVQHYFQNHTLKNIKYLEYSKYSLHTKLTAPIALISHLSKTNTPPTCSLFPHHAIDSFQSASRCIKCKNTTRSILTNYQRKRLAQSLATPDSGRIVCKHSVYLFCKSADAANVRRLILPSMHTIAFSLFLGFLPELLGASDAQELASIRDVEVKRFFEGRAKNVQGQLIST